MGRRKLLKRFHDPGHLHEFTYSSYQRRQLLLQDPWLKLLAESLTSACREEQIDLVAFVFMPAGWHALTLLGRAWRALPEVRSVVILATIPDDDTAD